MQKGGCEAAFCVCLIVESAAVGQAASLSVQPAPNDRIYATTT